MLSLAKVAALLSLAVGVLSAPSNNEPRANCGVLILAARGTDASNSDCDMVSPNYASLNNLGPVATSVSSLAGPSATLQPVPYPAATDFAQCFRTSVGIGVDYVQNAIQNQVNNCGSNAQVVILGYSQGASVMSAALVGGFGKSALPQSLRKNVITGAIFADPAYQANLKPLDNGGNATQDGTARGNSGVNYVTLNNVFGKRFRSYCEAGDAFCASGTGPDNITIHHQECQTYGSAAETFIGGFL